MDAKERLEKIKTIAREKIRIYNNIGNKDLAREWDYLLYLLTEDSWLNERYDFYTLSFEEFNKKYLHLYD